MSWAQRRGPGRPPTNSNPSVNMYNPNQHSSSENHWQNSDPHAWYQTAQQNQSYKQEVSQAQQPYQQHQQGYQAAASNQAPNANYSQQYQHDQGSYYQNRQGLDQQSYGNLQYNQQFDNRNNTFGGQAVTQPDDGWGDWGWGDENNSNAQSVVSHQPSSSIPSHSIGDSFTNDESWNWSVMDPQQVSQGENVSHPDPANLFPKIGDLKKQSKQHDNDLEPASNTSRNKLETPQWSTESQPSLESSDDVLHTSESDKSHIISRSSTISHSPISGQESLPLVQSSSNGELHGNSQYNVENREIVKQEMVAESKPVRVNPTPPPPKNLQTPPLFAPPQAMSDDPRNPYKRTTGLSHKSANMFRTAPTNPTESRQSVLPPSSNQFFNLETLPDNSEHPDHPPVPAAAAAVKTSAVKNPQWQQTENNEVPINDRNQYLETGQLSDVNLADVSEVSDLGNDTLPPPGLQRMIPGQLEQSEVGGSRLDEPLPGFSRMVLGQNENVPGVLSQNHTQYDLPGPPEGLRRMIPGESSSPEISLLQANVEENDSELELNQISQNITSQQPRSATIGADTPPIAQNPQVLSGPSSLPSNRSEATGVDILETTHGRGGSLLSTNNKITQNLKNREKSEQQESRRQAVEGQTNEISISNLTSAVRNLTVGENLTDGHTSNTSVPEHSPRRHSRQESSDSDSDRKKLSRSHRDARSMEKSKSREREREKVKESERYRYKDRDSDRYSPDPYRDRRDRGERRDKRYRDRRYEEDTDYYSDKEKDRRSRDDRDRDYERKYSSLRKEKDRRRKDRDVRDSRDYSRRDDYYYNRYADRDDYGPENRSSRPSSRSDSVHESYRERRHEAEPRDRRRRDRDRERERYRNRDPREAYNPYQSFQYDPYNPYYQQYQYYENLRRTNPQAYAEWYRKYYQHATGSTASYTGEDRASVHSGRSSANDELAKDSYSRPFDQTDNSLVYEEQPTQAQRLTPTKFATAHLKASLNSGNLLRILPNYPMDGQNAVVELCNLEGFLQNDPNYLELSYFPGPLVKGVTHKKQVIEYCDNKIKEAVYNREIVDVDSYILMWELLILLIRQNGMVVGADIAELLLKNRRIEQPPRPSSALSTTSSNIVDKNEISECSNQPVSEAGSTQSILKEEEVTKKFREYLLYGSCKEALEWAMKHGLWGHALFLASKLDKRTYANVMMRFANGLTINDPLQTLYQLLSGKMPAAVTCVSDEKWGDWRPHLAMILSNSTQRPELNCKAITHLGDTLLNRGSLYAAHFCYLMAEVGFGKHENPETRLVLLGSDHRKPFPQFVTNESIHMTEIYEFACSLNDQGFFISEFQLYKYILATRLSDYGFLDRALQYLEKLAGHIINDPSIVAPILVDRVCELSDKLKFYDPIGDADDETEFGALLETSRPDNSWLKDLRTVQSDLQAGRLGQEAYSNNYPDLHSTLQTEGVTLQQYNANQEIWQQQQYDQSHQDQRYEQQFDQQQQNWQTEPQTNQDYHQLQDNLQQQHNESTANAYQDQQQNYWSGQQPQNNQTWGDKQNQYNPENNVEHSQPPPSYDSLNNMAEDFNNAAAPPQISMPNKSPIKSAFDDEPLPRENQERKPSVPQPKPQSPKQEAKQSTGWFGGIFSKLSMKPKNQMKLPDDKNPKIVWDQEKKRWVNVDEDPNDPSNEFKPPPKLSDMMPKIPPPQSQPAVPGMDLSGSSLDYGSSLDFGSSFVYGSLNYSTTAPANIPQFNADQNTASASGPASMPNTVVAPAQNDDTSQKPAQANMFKMQRGRNLKNAYVNVFKQNGTTTANATSAAPAPEKLPNAALPQMNFFIPQPVTDPNAPVDFLTPGGVPAQIGEQQPNK